MTVPSQSPVSNHVGNGVTTTFPYEFKLLNEDDIKVSINGIVKTINVDYTVTGVGVEAGGSVVFSVAPAALAAIALVRKVAINRLTDYQYAGDFESETVNKDFDRVVMMVQDNDLVLESTIRFPEGDAESGVLPAAADRALKGFAFDADGKPFLTAASGNADVLAAALGSSAAATLGGGLVGFDPARAYAAGTVGDGIKDAISDAAAAQSNVNTFKTDVASIADAAKGAALMGYKVNATGSVGRLLSDKLLEFVSVKDFGAAGNGVAVDSGAFTNAMAAASTVIVPPGTYRFSSNFTIPNGKRLIFRDGAQLTIDNTFTLTIRGLVEAGVGQIFAGAGTVLGLRTVRPEWFGALRTGSANDDAPAFRKAQLCMEAGITSDGDDMVMLLSSGSYGLASQVPCTPNTQSCIQWRGQGSHAGTYLIGMASWTGSNGVIALVANAVNSSGSACRFSGFRMVPQTAGSGSLIGIIIGNHATLTLQGGAHEGALFEDVGVYDFATCWQITNARLFQFRRCSAWNQNVASGTCVSITAPLANNFTGDLDFDSCQITANASSSKCMNLAASVSTAQIAGVRFRSHIMYKGECGITASGGGKVSDVWFTAGWQYDVVAGNGFVIGSSGAGSVISRLQFHGGYWAGGLVSTFKAFNIFTTTSGKCQGIDISGNYFIQSWGDAIGVSNSNQISICRNQFVDPNGGSLVNFAGCIGVIINDNVLTRLNTSGSVSWLVTNSGSSNYYSIRNNMSSGFGGTVNDPSPGAQRIVDGNF